MQFNDHLIVLVAILVSATVFYLCPLRFFFLVCFTDKKKRGKIAIVKWDLKKNP